MSFLSDITRTITGGRGIGETTGSVLGSFYGPFGGAAGGVIGDKLSSSLSNLSDNTEGQNTARSVNQNLPSENAGSGNRMIDTNMYGSDSNFNQSFLGPLITGLGRGALQSGRQLLNPGNVGTGLGLGLLGGGVSTFMDSSGCQRRMVITRKMQREVKELFAYANGDMNSVAQIYSQFRNMNYTPQDILAIMLKKFRNDGPYVTKAAVRKTRQTVRKMKRLCDLYADITPRARPAARRRASSTTRITQVK